MMSGDMIELRANAAAEASELSRRNLFVSPIRAA
jgi:hypothetical protein